MDSLQARLEALEQHCAAVEKQRGAADRRLRFWRGVSVLAVAAAICLVPMSAQSDEGAQTGLAQRVAALEQKAATLQTALANETAARQAESAALLEELTPLETKLEKVSVEQDGEVYNIVIEGANLHLRNGLGATNGKPDAPFDTSYTVSNGMGNLIIGYNESPGTPLITYGSHNLVVGQAQNYASFGGLLAGRGNTLAGPYASVSGGSTNTASGIGSSVSGGGGNRAANRNASVSGGLNNTAKGWYASVSGGNENVAEGSESSVSGGWRRSVSGLWDWRAGGLSEDK